MEGAEKTQERLPASRAMRGWAAVMAAACWSAYQGSPEADPSGFPRRKASASAVYTKEAQLSMAVSDVLRKSP